jgi:hypothetical protein
MEEEVIMLECDCPQCPQCGNEALARIEARDDDTGYRELLFYCSTCSEAYQDEDCLVAGLDEMLADVAI